MFLRVLEYFRGQKVDHEMGTSLTRSVGIMFLTTNQIAQFDVAVQSRVHIAIKYQDLNDTQTCTIFDKFLRQYENQDAVDDPANIKKYVGREMAKKHFDGRQIRNIVSSAMGLAQAKDRKMNVEDIKQVVGIVEDFKNDLHEQMFKYKERQAQDKGKH